MTFTVMELVVAKRNFVRSCLLNAGLICFVSGCFDSEPPAPASAGAKPLQQLSAEVVNVSAQPWPKVVRSHGNLIPDDRADVGSRIDGRVETVHIDLGDVVTEGMPLVTLSQTELKLRIAQAEAQLMQARAAVGLKPDVPLTQLDPENAPPVLEQKAVWNEAKTNLERATQLLSRKSITAAEMEQYQASESVAEARFRSALNGVHEKIALIGVREAEVALAKEDFTNSVIVAPFNGVVQQRHVSPGTYVRVGDSTATIVRLDQLRFHGTISERFAMELKVGQSLQLQIESIDEPVTATISRTSPAIDLASRSLQFEAVIDNSDGRLRSGLFAEARIVINSNATAIAVPPSSLVDFAGAEKVWKVVNGESREQTVLTGERRPEGVEIVQGLHEGDVILLDGNSGAVAKITVIDSLQSKRTDSAGSADITQAGAGSAPGSAD